LLFPSFPLDRVCFVSFEAEVEASGDAGEASLWGGTSSLLPVDVEAETSLMLVQPLDMEVKVRHRRRRARFGSDSSAQP
jgi:hypothetical protein